LDPPMKTNPGGSVMFSSVMLRVWLVLFTEMLKRTFREPASMEVLGVTHDSNPDAWKSESVITRIAAGISARTVLGSMYNTYQDRNK